MWDLIVSVPDHCLSLYFKTFLFSFKTLNRYISAALIMGKELKRLVRHNWEMQSFLSKLATFHFSIPQYVYI